MARNGPGGLGRFPCKAQTKTIPLALKRPNRRRAQAPHWIAVDALPAAIYPRSTPRCRPVHSNSDSYPTPK